MTIVVQIAMPAPPRQVKSYVPYVEHIIGWESLFFLSSVKNKLSDLE